jgi:predicted transcriptional regulator
MPTSVKIDSEMKSRIKQLADIQQRSPHWIMRTAICEYVEREEKREKFRQEALESWKQYKATGKHLTGEEVGEWLSTWGTKSETELPPCHK